MGDQRGADMFGEHCPAAEREDCLASGLPGPRGPIEQLADELLLVLAKGGLAVELELAGDRVSEALFEQPVGVERLRAELGGDFGGGGRLAGAHEADEDERAGQRRHRIRSS